MEIVVCIVLFIVISALIMIGTNIAYDLAAALMPIVAFIMITVGIIIGFIVAIKNTVIVYKQVYSKKGK